MYGMVEMTFSRRVVTKFVDFLLVAVMFIEWYLVDDLLNRKDRHGLANLKIDRFILASCHHEALQHRMVIIW